ncbi:hypothetical protein [Pelovirga terrestris]|uniref:Periplasmic heavy metal sensor n=1 Tax=Pelovirga terrestris TaxID=2771352 RepID=A0A8J6UGF4_9BACT|nr:hypothetical protein [Pelovirga terrestris]MBD1399658.1 hypothetical protein [Pelovirga terrestris]
MKRVLGTTVLIGLFLGATVLTGFAASDHEAHHPGGEQTAAPTSSEKMMMTQAAKRGQMPCMADSASGSTSQMMGMMGGKGTGGMMSAGMSGMMGGDGRHSMMHGGQMGMMAQGMGHMFYLDRADELGLSADQVSKLKAIHVEGRKDNIRNAAEAHIVRLELAELIAGETWTLKDAESLIRKVQNLEGDMQIRHLQALSDARKVLTAEQLKQARTDGGTDNPESLFQ